MEVVIFFICLTLLCLFLSVKSAINEEFDWAMIFIACFAFSSFVTGVLLTAPKTKMEDREVKIFKDEKGRKYFLEQKVDTIYIYKDTCVYGKNK